MYVCVSLSVYGMMETDVDVTPPSSPPPPSFYDAEKKFIQTYEKLPILWDSKHDHYFNKYKRKEALQKLLKIYKYIKSTASIYDVRMKINGLRTYYRKEMKKVQLSKMTSSSPLDVYKPKSWTFELLHFLNSEIKLSLTRNTNESDNSEQSQDIVNENNESEAPSTTYRPSKKPIRNIIIKRKNKPKLSRINKSHSPLPSQVSNIFKVKNPIAFIWADKLENLQPQQRLFAEKAINDVLFEAELENLDRFSVKINASKNHTSYAECYVSTRMPSPTSSNRNHRSSASSSLSDDGNANDSIIKREELHISD
ncbi:uncharacterized protein LOC113519350 [Galleria mellonella]|uniref:Uncharacterized protein LOC113519350 n=1 Tax=Galleria mellonella TaxID=7137 RepID=A0A6J1WVK0_GALME|nr:uncharacterized protein LOC113519350 [Galleria mellonella]